MTVDDFHRLTQAQILKPDDRIELIEGDLVDMAPIGGPHAHAVARNLEVFSQVKERVLLWCQGPLRLSEHSELYPDLALVRKPKPGTDASIPGPSDVLLVIEVSDTTLRHDRETKLPLYATHGVVEAWIQNLAERQLEVYRRPEGQMYRERSILSTTDSIALLLLPELQISVADIF